MRAEDLQQDELREIQASFIPDKFKGLRGPGSVTPSFLDELARIDRRLVIRWNPYRRLYVIHTKMSRSGKLWCQPVHTVHDGNWKYRKPSRWDLRQIARAAWQGRLSGSKFWQIEAEKLMAAQDKETEEERTKLLQQWALDVSKKWDLCSADFAEFGVTRGVAGGNKKNRFKGVPDGEC